MYTDTWLTVNADSHVGPAHPPAKVVEHHDVGIHVIQVVAVGRVLFACPVIWARALVREHVVTVLGLIIHTVKPCHLGRREGSEQQGETGSHPGLRLSSAHGRSELSSLGLLGVARHLAEATSLPGTTAHSVPSEPLRYPEG